MKSLMIQGTGSGVGKSLVAVGLCRLFANEGAKVTPFKSQNMTADVYETLDGKIIAQSQGMQAEAAKVEATVWMNPILLKPGENMETEVIFFGEKEGELSGFEYRDKFYQTGLEAIKTSLQQLRKDFDVVVIEGAGSPAEVNLKDRELVNMKVAEIADAPVLLVADIERGSVFASIIGTLQLLAPEERNRVKGIVINKFRGDVKFFRDGIQWLEENTGIPVMGVLPVLEYMEAGRIFREDQYDRLADDMKRFLDWEKIKAITDEWSKET